MIAIRDLCGDCDGSGDAGASGIELGVYVAAGSCGDAGGAQRGAERERGAAMVEYRFVLLIAIDAIFVGGSIFEYQAGDVAANRLVGTFVDADVWRGLCAGGGAAGDVVVSLSELEAGLSRRFGRIA